MKANRFIFRWLLMGMVVWALVCFGVSIGSLPISPLYAQEATPTPAAANPVTADEVNAVASELWCPLCSGVRLDVCEQPACVQMRDLIALKLAEGEDSESIRAYFLDYYGPEVLGQPPLEGFNWLAWILPFVVLALGGFFLLTTVRRMVQPMATTVGAIEPTTEKKVTPNPAEDDYAGKLAEELKRYG
jgi:cytochrome c-type biogenesis protein CcmH